MADYLKPYRRAVEEHGPCFEAMLWRSRENQRERFGVLAGMIDLTGRTVLDAGCGLADFAAYLVESGVGFKAYVGMEAIDRIAAQANERALPRTGVVVSDFVADAGAFGGRFPGEPGEKADVIVFSGSLNTMGRDMTLGVLDRAWRACGWALGFNFLSDRFPEQAESEGGCPVHRQDPVVMLKWALDRTPLVSLRHDYMGGHDATVVMRRGPG